MATIIGKFVKNSSQRELDRLKSIVEKINELEPKIKKIPNKIFQKKLQNLNQKLKWSIKLEDLIPEAFACVREAARRTLG